jgi:hypothetical protein
MSFTSSDVTTYLKKDGYNGKDLALYFASSGYYQCVSKSVCSDSFDIKTALDSDLNNAPGSVPGAIIRFKSSKKYYYICSRNNNFSNRSQKGSIVVL